MSEPASGPDVHAEAALALIQAENDYRSAMVGPVSAEALSLLEADHPADTAAREAAPPGPAGEPDR